MEDGADNNVCRSILLLSHRYPCAGLRARESSRVACYSVHRNSLPGPAHRNHCRVSLSYVSAGSRLRVQKKMAASQRSL